MPKIIGQAEQQQALKEITSMLKEVVAVNTFLSSRNTSGKYTVSFSDEHNQKHSCTLFSSDKEDVDLLVLNYKDRLKGKIQALAEEFRIALEPQEQLLLEADFSSDITNTVHSPDTNDSTTERFQQ